MSTDIQEEESLDWLLSSRPGFGRVTPAAEFRYEGPASADHSVTETWWFELSDAKSGLSASFYINYRPNLNTCSAGAWMWRGIKKHQILADHLNYQVMLAAPAFAGNTIAAPAVGLTFEIVKPFEEIRITYAPPGLDASAALSVTGLFPPAMRSNERHFEQATRTKGHILIGDERFEIDTPSFRDRSFGEPRREDHVVHPPIGWLYGVVGDGSAAFNLSGGDDPAGGPVWADTYPMPSEKMFYDGWIMQDGRMRKIVSMSKRTVRDAEDRLRPLSIEVDFVDEDGGKHRLEGKVRSSYQLAFWPNLHSWFGMTDWTLDGVGGTGGAQDYAWPDYCRKFWK